MNKQVTLCIGRFSPPHIGHYKIFKTAKQEYLDRKLDGCVIMIINGKKTRGDKERNPIIAADRARYIKDSDIGVGIDVRIEDDVLGGLQNMVNDGLEPVLIVGGINGSDDDSGPISYLELLDKYVENRDHDCDILPVSRDGSEIDVFASGTLVRFTARRGDYEEFESLMPFDDQTNREIYDKIRETE